VKETKTNFMARKILATAIILSLLIALGWFILRVTQGLGNAALRLPNPMVYLALIPLILLALFFHELGHVVGGLLAGFRFISLVSGPLRVIATAKGVRIGLNRNPDQGSGMATTLPMDGRNLQRRLLAAVAGGPLSNLLLALVAGDLAIYLLPAAPELGALAGMTGLASLAIFLATFSPYSSDGGMSDGAQLLSLLRDEPQTELRNPYLEIQAISLQGVRPRDWPITTLVKAFSGCDQKDDDWAAAGLLAYYHALDSGDTAAAGGFLEQVLGSFATYSLSMRYNLALEAAFYQARHHQDPIQGRAWLARGQDGIFGPHARLRAEAAVLLAEGNPELAAQKAREGLEAVDEFYDRGLVEAEKEWLEAMILQGDQSPRSR
jgi:hypothetical protein